MSHQLGVLVFLVVMTSVNLIMNSRSCLSCLVGTLAFSRGHAFIHAEERAGKRKTEKTALQDDNSHLAELDVGFVKNNSQES